VLPKKKKKKREGEINRGSQQKVWRWKTGLTLDLIISRMRNHWKAFRKTLHYIISYLTSLICLSYGARIFEGHEYKQEEYSWVIVIRDAKYKINTQIFKNYT
jgi:hypothetical protein